MVTLLRKLFIKDYQNVADEKVRTKHGLLAAIFGIISNLILVTMKLAVAFILAAHVVKSNPEAKFLSVLPMALIGDAINNLGDMASSFVTLIGFKIASKPADKEHPFGHERIEYIAGLIVSTIVMVLSLTLFRDSLTKVIDRETVQYELVTVIILGVSVLIKAIQGYFNYQMGKAISSSALKATSLDSLTDAIGTFLIMISGILSLTLKWNFLDGYMGILISLFVFYSGIKMMKETSDPLIGERNNATIQKEVVDDVLSHPSIKGVHDVLCHSYGPTKYFVSLHAEIDQNMNIVAAHELIDGIEEEIRKKFHCEITIHMDPIAVGDPFTDETKKKVTDVLHSLDKNIGIHDFRIVKGEKNTNVIFDIVTPFDEKLTEKDILETLSKAMNDETHHYSFIIHFDHPF